MSSVEVQRMSSAPLAPRVFSEDPLIASKLSLELDKKFVSSSKQVLLQRIEFKPATKPDEQYEKLKKKYPPLNSTNGLNVEHIYRNGSMSANAVGADEDIPAPKVVLHSLEKLELEWKSIRRIGPGLSNMGNTCFLNSVLQVLTYTAPLVNHFSNGAGHCRECRVVGFCMMCELQRHIARTFSHHQNETIKPMAIINKLKQIVRHFKLGRQEDAHEFLRYVIDGMQKSCLPSDMDKKLDRYSKETSLVHGIFGGYYRSQVRCLKCHNTSNTFDPLMEIMLDIKHAPSVTRALQRSVKIELLNGENLYHCPRCKKKVPAHKQVLIHRTPNVLTIHLKRFDYNQMFGGKISKDVDYTEQLDLRPFMTTKGLPVVYRLYAVLVHSGHSCNSGHYYSYVRASNGMWYNMNDAMVRQAGLKAALSQQAYLLFYTKADNEEPKVLLKSLLRQTSLNVPTTPPSATSPNLPRLIRESDHGTPVSKSKSGIFFKNTPNSTSTIAKSTATTSPTPSPLVASSERPKLSFTVAVKGKAGSENCSAIKSESTIAANSTSALASPDSSKKLSASGSTRNHSVDVSVDQAKSNTSTIVQRKESLNSVPVESFPLRKEDSNKSPPPKKPRPPPLFIPRAVGRRQPSNDSLPHTSEEVKNATTPKCTTPWKVTPRRSNEPLFGPMSPPPSGVVLPQQSPCSARSDLSSTSSIMGKSGEWTVSNKMDNTPGPMLPERQHAGWQVKINSMTNNEDLKEEETKGTSSEVEERNQRNNKKHKKEKRKKKEKKENVKGKYQKLDESQSEWVDKEELKKEKRKRNKSDKKKKKKKKWNKQRASDDERKSLLIEDSTKKKRKNKGDGDAEQAKRCRLVDYSDGSSSEGHQESEGNSSDVKKNDLNSDVVHPKRSTPVLHDCESPAKGARMMLWDGSRDSSVVKELLLSGGGLQGYGSSVPSWEGGQSLVDRHHNEDLEPKQQDSDDEWNEDIDRGKVKKVKTKLDSDEKVHRRCNPFQRVQDRKSSKVEPSDRVKACSRDTRHHRTPFKRHKSPSNKGHHRM